MVILKSLSSRLFCLLFIFYQGVFSQSPESFIEKSGDFGQIFLPVVALGSSFFIKSDEQAWMQFTESFGVSLLTTHFLKRSISKWRPDGSNDNSFPSGHTSAAFSGASFLQIKYGWKIGIPAYLLASWVGYTRIYAKKHDLWDVLAGAGIGIGASLLFVKKYHTSQKILMINKQNGFYMVSCQIKF